MYISVTGRSSVSSSDVNMCQQSVSVANNSETLLCGFVFTIIVKAMHVLKMLT